MAVLVENGGFGASAAAPIARKIMDAYLLPRLKPGEVAPAVPHATGGDEAVEDAPAHEDEAPEPAPPLAPAAPAAPAARASTAATAKAPA